MNNIRIGVKVIGCIALLLVLVCTSLSYIAYERAIQSATNMLQENIKLMAVAGTKIVKAQLDYHQLGVENIAHRTVIKSMNWQEQLPALEDEIKRLGYQQVGVATPDGQARLTDGTTPNVSEREYFKQAMTGKNIHFGCYHS